MKLDPATIDHFLIYAGTYRAFVILTGAAGMWLGYRLFQGKAGRGKAVAAGGADLDASIAGNTLSLKGAAPGTFFALFGAGLIVAMVVTGNPSLTLEEIRQAAASDSTSVDSSQVAPGVIGGSIRFGMRASQTEAIQDIEREFDRGAITGENAYLRLLDVVKEMGEGGS